MTGRVDEKNRALIDIQVGGQLTGPFSTVTAWIDTAFDGHLVFSADLIKRLDLESLVQTEAILADGSKVVLETYIAYVPWFGNCIPLQVIANEGRFPLLGTGLLEQRVLHIDYIQQVIQLD